MGWNVPDDWGNYYSTCGLCGTKYHDSEGGCGCTEDLERCDGGGCHNMGGLEAFHPIEDLTEIQDRHYCKHCLECECCGDLSEVAYNEEHGLLLCPGCIEEEHVCPKDRTVLDHIVEATKA
jgi:hypothetical protein